MPETNPTDLEVEIETLAEAFVMAGHRLTETAGDLTHHGRPPSIEIAAEMERMRQRFADLRDLLICLAMGEGFLPLKEWAAVATIQHLRDLHGKLEERRKTKGENGVARLCAQEVLERIGRIRVRDGSDLSPLNDCQAKCRRLVSAVSGASPWMDPSASISPYARLLLLVELGEALTDDLWLQLQDAVAAHFGRALATAAARGRLVVMAAPDSSTVTEKTEHARPNAEPLAEPPVTVSPAEETGSPPGGNRDWAPVAVGPVDTVIHPHLQIREKILRKLEVDKDIPAFPAAAQKLLEASNQAAIDLDRIADIVKLDPGLASKYLRLANSAALGGRAISSVSEALLRIGFEEIRRVAMSVKVIDSLTFLRAKVDWNLFWMHSLLTARITEVLADAYRPTTGREYVGGLLHDIGKLFIGHYFPHEFRYVVARATEKACSLIEVEREFLDIAHPEVASVLAEKWGLDHEIVHAVFYHHETEALCAERGFSDSEALLATCICVADAVANLCHANIQGGTLPSGIDFESSSQWMLLQRFAPRLTLQLDVAAELQRTQEILASYAPAEPAVASPHISQVL